MMHSSHQISDPASLRPVCRPASGHILKKQVRRLDSHARDVIRLPPFVVPASRGGCCKAGAAPRGGPPGDVAVLDESRLLLADRPGKNRLGSLGKILRFPLASLSFTIPERRPGIAVSGPRQPSSWPGLAAGRFSG